MWLKGELYEKWTNFMGDCRAVLETFKGAEPCKAISVIS